MGVKRSCWKRLIAFKTSFWAWGVRGAVPASSGASEAQSQGLTGMILWKYEQASRKSQGVGRETLGDFGKAALDELRAVEGSVRQAQLEAPKTSDEREALNKRKGKIDY